MLQSNSKCAKKGNAIIRQTKSTKEKVCAPHASHGRPHGLEPHIMSQPIWDSFLIPNSLTRMPHFLFTNIRLLQHIKAANHFW